MIEFIKVLQAISDTMPCDKCPYPCDAKWKSSQANCDRRWFEILSAIDKPTWTEVLDKLIYDYINKTIG